MQSARNRESVNVGSLIPDFTFIYQIRTKLLEPWVLQWDWITLHYIADKSKLINGHVYLVDSPDGKMVKRLEMQEDYFILSLPVSRTDYPTIKVPRSTPIDFYDIVSRISNNVSGIFNEQAVDVHYMAIAAIEANKQLLINETKAHDNTMAALQIIDKLTNK